MTNHTERQPVNQYMAALTALFCGRREEKSVSRIHEAHSASTAGDGTAFRMAAHLHQTDSHKNECLLLSSRAR